MLKAILPGLLVGAYFAVLTWLREGKRLGAPDISLACAGFIGLLCLVAWPASISPPFTWEWWGWYILFFAVNTPILIVVWVVGEQVLLKGHSNQYPHYP
jgi:hypothetical protein